MSVVKLLSRIVSPSDLDIAKDDQEAKLASKLHDHTYGITSDPLTQFACAFSALIHDMDHQGIPNAVLVTSDPMLSRQYENRSIAEQNSLSLAWDLLMDSRFRKLRSIIYTSRAELQRFRELVVNSVMATDIVDKDLKELRNGRWNRAFHNSACTDGPRDAIDRKATIVLEHLIQASDIAHTMQHWHVYRKWNERLFEEMYQAYIQGRSTTNPADFWAKGEIGFFDVYIIPLAKKLKDCGVFGISSDEYLKYAESNRKEWQQRGASVVSEMIEKLQSKPNLHGPTKPEEAPRIV